MGRGPLPLLYGNEGFDLCELKTMMCMGGLEGKQEYVDQLFEL